MPNRSILHIEDEESDVLLLRHAFGRAGITDSIFVASDGRQALNYLSGAGPFANRREFPLPCLVLLDLKLPDQDGLELLQWMRSHSDLKTTVVVAFTSSDHAHDIKRAYELGVNSYVVKPNTTENRVQFAQHLKGWWLGQNKFCTDAA